MTRDFTIDEIFSKVRLEFETARLNFKEFNTYHEGLSIINEEVFELTEEVRKKNPNKEQMIKEATQIGAMAARFVHDLCSTNVDGTGRRW